MPDSAWESPTDLQSQIRPHGLARLDTGLFFLRCHLAGTKMRDGVVDGPNLIDTWSSDDGGSATRESI